MPFWGGGGGYSNLLLVHLQLKHRGNVFFPVRMLEKITIQGRSVAIRLTDNSVSIFKETIKNTEKDRVAKLWNKNVQSNKSLAKKKELYS